MEQKLRIVVQTVTSINLVRRWMRHAPAPLEAEDILRVREIETDRVRSEIEELARKHVGEDRYEALLDAAEALVDEREKKLAPAVGTFMSKNNGMLWRVS